MEELAAVGVVEVEAEVEAEAEAEEKGLFFETAADVETVA